MAFELRSLLFEDDPYPRMKHFRENDYAGEHQGWYLFRHADVLELLHDNRFSSEQGWPDLAQTGLTQRRRHRNTSWPVLDLDGRVEPPGRWGDPRRERH